MIELFKPPSTQIKDARLVKRMPEDEYAERQIENYRSRKEAAAEAREARRRQTMVDRRLKQIAVCRLRIKQMEERIASENALIDRYREEIS